MTDLQLVESIAEDIKEHLSFRVYQGAIPGAAYGTDRYTECVRRLCDADPSFVATTSELARRFYSGDIGSVDEGGKAEREANGDRCNPYFAAIDDMEVSRSFGSRYGCYTTRYGTVCIDREGWYTVMYFPFER